MENVAIRLRKRDDENTERYEDQKLLMSKSERNSQLNGSKNEGLND